MSLTYLQPINSSQAIDNEQVHFPLFNDLPKELRAEIWRYAMQRRRLIRVQSKYRKPTTVYESGDGPDCVANGERYYVAVHATLVLSKFLRVNMESRKEALTFYRVHLPCRFFSTSVDWTRSIQGTLYFNPEWDILCIATAGPAEHTLVPLLYQLKTIHDPRHVGLLNLAIIEHGLQSWWGRLQISSIDSKMMPAFVETLTQLREVWFVSLSGIGRGRTHPMFDLQYEPFFNRSLPIFTRLSTFERLPRDPRSVRGDLENVPDLGHSRDLLGDWLRSLKRWHITPHKITYRFLSAYDPRMEGDYVPRAEGFISSRVSASAWLQNFEDQRNDAGHDDEYFKYMDAKSPDGIYNREDENEVLKELVRPAFGFWLFSLDEFARIDEEGRLVDGENWLLVRSEDDLVEGLQKKLMFRDMTSHWPELGLSVLS